MSFSPDFWIGLSLGIAGVAATLAVAWYQRQVPTLTIAFDSSDGPDRLVCRLRNSGRGQARGVTVGFNLMLPIETVIYSAPEIGATLHESDLPPDPAAGPAAAALQRAFAVVVSRVAPKDTVQFELRSLDADNQRAARQVIRITAEIASILAEFGTRLQAQYPELGSLWHTDLIVRARTKRDSFFKPSTLSYELGRFPISALSDDEQLADANCQDLYPRFKREFIDIFQGRPSFVAPVVKVKTAAGARTYATLPPFVNTYVDMAVSPSALQAGATVVLYPPVPESYE